MTYRMGVQTYRVGAQTARSARPSAAVRHHLSSFAWTLALGLAFAVIPQLGPDFTVAAQESDQGSLELVDGKLPQLEDGFPDAPITLWAAFPAGHGDDLLNRKVAEIASKYSPVRIAVDTFEAGPNMSFALLDNYLPNLPRAQEGYHIHTANWLGMAVRPYSTETTAKYEQDFLTPINGIMYRPFVYATPLDSEWDSLEDVVEAAHADPDGYRFCAGTSTSTVTLAGYSWMDQADVEMTFVPSDGSGAAQTLMLGGGCEFSTWTYIPGMEENYKLLAITGNERNPALPDLPTLKELGYQSVGGSLSGYGILPQVPEEHVEWFNALFQMVVEDPELAKAYQGADIRFYTAEQVREAMDADIDAFYPLLEDLDMAVRER